MSTFYHSQAGAYSFAIRKLFESSAFSHYASIRDYLRFFYIYEVKFLKDRMEKSLMEEEIAKIRAIPSFRARNIGFISSSGFACQLNDAILIDGNDIYCV